MTRNAHSPVNPTSQTSQEQSAPVSSSTAIAQAKELWFEVMFYLALFFGCLHFTGLTLQIAGMFLHTALKLTPFRGGRW